jgi:predicted RNA methylase
MLELAGTGGDDFVLDLGSGDGRIVITAAQKYGVRGLGVDSEMYRVDEAKSNAEQAGVNHLVEFQHQDAMTVDLAPATVITLYLVQWSTEKLGSVLRSRAKPGTRVVSHNFPIRDWNPVKVVEHVDGEGATHKLFLWVCK